MTSNCTFYSNDIKENYSDVDLWLIEESVLKNDYKTIKSLFSSGVVIPKSMRTWAVETAIEHHHLEMCLSLLRSGPVLQSSVGLLLESAVEMHANEIIIEILSNNFFSYKDLQISLNKSHKLHFWDIFRILSFEERKMRKQNYWEINKKRLFPIPEEGEELSEKYDATDETKE